MTPLIHMVNDYSSTWLVQMWGAIWEGGIALGLVFLINRAFPRIPPAIQCWMWRLAILKLLLASIWINHLELPILPAGETTSANLQAERLIAPPHDVRFEAETNGASTMSPLSVRSFAIGAELHMTSWLMLVWLAGAVLSALALLRNWIHIRRLTRDMPRVTDDATIQCVSECCAASNTRITSIHLSSESIGPFLVGAFRPCIVLPSSLTSPGSREELRFAILHELAHVRRRDLMWNWFPAIAGVVFFFHPLVWLAKRELLFGQEAATDELTVSTSGRSIGQYARSLVELTMKHRSMGTIPEFAVGSSSSYPQLCRRLIAMQHLPTITILRRRLLVASLVLAATIGIVPWKVVAQQPEAIEEIPPLPRVETPLAPDLDVHLDSRTITISVVDSDGKPLAGARVFRNHVYQLGDQERPKIENKNYRTDADGHAVVELSGDSVDLRIWVMLRGFVSLHAMWAEKFQSDGHLIPAQFTFTMKRGTEIGGVVTDESGKPIKGVTVEVRDMTAGERVGISKPGKRPVRAYMLSSGKNAVRTDGNGRWKLSGVPDDETLKRSENEVDRRDDAVPQIAVRLSHPDYDGDKMIQRGFSRGREWGGLQRKQGITLKSMRLKTATIVLERKTEDNK